MPTLASNCRLISHTFASAGGTPYAKYRQPIGMMAAPRSGSRSPARATPRALCRGPRSVRGSRAWTGFCVSPVVDRQSARDKLDSSKNLEIPRVSATFSILFEAASAASGLPQRLFRNAPRDAERSRRAFSRRRPIFWGLPRVPARGRPERMAGGSGMAIRGGVQPGRSGARGMGLAPVFRNSAWGAGGEARERV